ncbi:MAG TPA: nucleotide exchange factor GrpE [Bdellovibrionota bacterium]|jgi:molecular chaperone GrpE|nr:nucleotide exchange factor GrpE [Bdellovibrionota bacterium]
MSDTQNKAEQDVNESQAEEVLSAVDEAVAEENKAQGAETLVNEWKSKAAYLAAELENMKKRAIRDRTETIKFANESLLKLVVPVLDNLSLALSSAKNAKVEDSALLKSLVEGVEMTVKLFEQTLAQAGVEFIVTDGAEFDPEVHEAIGQAQNADLKDGAIVTVVQRGFKLSGRVVRTAKVIVNKTN